MSDQESDPQRDSQRDPLKRIIRHMDGADPADGIDKLREELGESDAPPPEDYESLIEFDARVGAAVPPVSPEMAAKLDGAYGRVSRGEGSKHVGKAARSRRLSIEVWVGIAVAIAAGIFLMVYVDDSGDRPLEFDFAILDTTRSGDREGAIAYRLQAVLGETAYWYVFERDENNRIHVVFPFFDSDSGSWDYLGYDDNRFDAGSAVVLPRPGTMDALVAVGSVGASEDVFAVASREAVPLAELLKLAGELEALIARGVESGRAQEEIGDELESLLQSRFDAVRTEKRTYE